MHVLSQVWKHQVCAQVEALESGVSVELEVVLQEVVGVVDGLLNRLGKTVLDVSKGGDQAVVDLWAGFVEGRSREVS